MSLPASFLAWLEKQPPARQEELNPSDDMLTVQFGYTSWDNSCKDHYSPRRQCRRRKGHKGVHASGFGEHRLRWVNYADFDA